MSTSHWYFEGFCLDLTHVCLWRGTEVVPLPPKAFDVLHYLVTHPDRVVTKDELLDAVWSQTAVSEAAVRVAIGVLRKALDDTAQLPRYIVTVARRGYRFVATVTAEGPGVPVSATSPAQEPLLSPLPPGPVPTSPVAPTPPRSDAPAGALPPVEAERRLLTVWFCDLVNSTRLSGRLDPEDYREVVRAYHQTCVEVIQRFDGYIAQYLGDGVLGYFGYPVAHEDDAQRAVRAGLGLLEALGPLNARLVLPFGERLAVRLGVHTGLVVIGEVGTGTYQEPLALGETPNLAARLQQLATPDTLLISAATFQLVEGYFTYERLRTQPLKGLAQPLLVYRILGASGAQSRLDVAATRGLTPLVGRDAEVALLLERWHRVQAGQGQVVLLIGEAGLGKSRLVRVLQDQLAADMPMILEGRGSPYDAHTALYPVVDLLQRYLQWRPGDAPDIAMRRLETLLAQTQLPLVEAMPLLATLLELPLTIASSASPVLGPEQRRHTFELLLALVGGLAERQPVLLVLEDLHWMDPSTLEWLTRLLDEVPTTRLYCVLTCRPIFQLPWGFRACLTPLVLAPLTPPQVEAMVEDMLGGRRLALAVRRQIVAQTDGNPLFVEEVTKAVVETGAVVDVPEPGTATHTMPPGAIPVTLHEALLARLDRLGSAKGVAQLGAILGRQFSYVLLRAVAPLEEEALQQALAALVSAEIVYQRRQPPQAVYTFKHALLQEAAYALVLHRERRQAHRRILQVLLGQGAETGAPAPTLLAYHALHGEQWEQAVAYLREAGEQAIARSAYREAVAAFEQALEVIPRLPEHHDTLVQTLELHLALRSALWTLGELSQLCIHLQHAAALAETLGDTHRLGWVMVYLALSCIAHGELDRALQYGQRALAMATTIQDMRLTVISRNYLGLVAQFLGVCRWLKLVYK